MGTQRNIVLEKTGAVIAAVPVQLQRFRHHIQGGGLPGTVAAVEDGHGLQLQFKQSPGGKHLEGIKAVVALALDGEQKIEFLFIVGKGKSGQIQHGGYAPQMAIR